MITYSEATTIEECEAQDAAAMEALVLDNLLLSNVGHRPIRRPADAQATRYQTNPNWSYRGDNTKYRETK